MKRNSFFVGIDIGSKSFVSTISNLKSSYTEEFANNVEGFSLFTEWLKKNKATKAKSIIVMETTGVYSEQLCHNLYEKGFDLCVENSLKVKRAFGISPLKNDIVDSKRIAEYALRFTDKLTLWQPPQTILEEVNILLSLREQFVNQSTANKNILKALSKKVNKNIFAIESLESFIAALKSKINEIEKQIKNLLLSDSSIGSKYINLISIPGVGLLLSSELLVLTNGFIKTQNHKEISSYLGICPHENSSGTIIKKARSSGYGHPRIRKLIYLASCCVKGHNQDFTNYFNRKVKEGKSGRLLINNIANKLIKIICGVIKSGKPFIPNFKSLSPILAV